MTVTLDEGVGDLVGDGRPVRAGEQDVLDDLRAEQVALDAGGVGEAVVRDVVVHRGHGQVLQVLEEHPLGRHERGSVRVDGGHERVFAAGDDGLGAGGHQSADGVELVIPGPTGSRRGGRRSRRRRRSWRGRGRTGATGRTWRRPRIRGAARPRSGTAAGQQCCEQGATAPCGGARTRRQHHSGFPSEDRSAASGPRSTVHRHCFHDECLPDHLRASRVQCSVLEVRSRG